MSKKALVFSSGSRFSKRIQAKMSKKALVFSSGTEGSSDEQVSASRSRSSKRRISSVSNVRKKDAKKKKVNKNAPAPTQTNIEEKKQKIPKKINGYLKFKDHPEFTPTLSPSEVLKAGAFGGTYFRDIDSIPANKKFIGLDVIKEFPAAWFKGLDIDRMVCCPYYDARKNKFQEHCGGGLDMWENSGWISPQDPYGWFQWYCRFFLGRRSTDDDRQIARWVCCAGKSGRWKSNLTGKISRKGAALDDHTVSPKIRQILLHWAYELTEKDANAYIKKKGLAPLAKSKGVKLVKKKKKIKLLDPYDMKSIPDLKLFLRSKQKRNNNFKK